MPHGKSFLGRNLVMRRTCLCLLFVLALAGASLATVFGTVRGIVHDPQHRPVSGIQVVLKAKASEFNLEARTDRSEEHTSELQSLRHLVCRLLLEKKKKFSQSDLMARLCHAQV